jgi:hypothetical protein
MTDLTSARARARNLPRVGPGFKGAVRLSGGMQQGSCARAPQRQGPAQSTYPEAQRSFVIWFLCSYRAIGTQI